MTNMDFLSVSSPSSYWQTSRAPRYSLSFALPLLLFYQVLAVLLAHGTRAVRNGADVILQSLFVAVAGSWGPLVFMVCLIGVGLWLVARDLRKNSRLREFLRRSRATSHSPTPIRQTMNTSGPHEPATATNRLCRMTSAPFRTARVPCASSTAST